MDSETYNPLPGTQLFVNKSFKSVTDSNGAFAIYVSVSDTIIFSRTGYKPADVIISDTLVGKQYIAGIFMSQDTLQIGEVIIVPRVSNLRSEIMNTRTRTSPEVENARHNVAVSAYQGRTTTGKLGDPATNYEMLRQRQRINAYERGGIPSDRIVGLSPFMLIPAAYLLMNGLPEKPASFKPDISDRELDEIMKRYLEKNKPTLPE
ncbi:MAG: hypothetical protein ACM3UT_00130 [Chloroflexota bacterium]